VKEIKNYRIKDRENYNFTTIMLYLLVVLILISANLTHLGSHEQPRINKQYADCSTYSATTAVTRGEYSALRSRGSSTGRFSWTKRRQTTLRYELTHPVLTITLLMHVGVM